MGDGITQRRHGMGERGAYTPLGVVRAVFGLFTSHNGYYVALDCLTMLLLAQKRRYGTQKAISERKRDRGWIQHSVYMYPPVPACGIIFLMGSDGHVECNHEWVKSIVTDTARHGPCGPVFVTVEWCKLCGVVAPGQADFDDDGSWELA